MERIEAASPSAKGVAAMRKQVAKAIQIGMAAILAGFLQAGTPHLASRKRPRPVTPAWLSRGQALDLPTFTGHVRPFLKRYCFSCHGEQLQEGDLRLDQLEADFLARESSDHWAEVLDRINLGEMPPEGEPKPDERSVLHDGLAHKRTEGGSIQNGKHRRPGCSPTPHSSGICKHRSRSAAR